MKSRLIELLNERKNLTLNENDFKIIVFETYNLLGDFDSNAVYQKIKSELIDENIITQISGGKKIKIIREKKENELENIKNSTHWNGLIHAIAMSEKNLQNLKNLEKINDFLNIEKEREKVFLKERSYEIFKDEKFLDDKVKNGYLFNGKLHISALKCTEKPSPLVYESVCKNKPVLVCENSNTYHTICRWNKEFMEFSAIIYGSGNIFSGAHNYLDEIRADLGFNEIYYFGDFDYDGFFIPANTNQKRLENGLLEIKPALFLYKVLINFSPIKNQKNPKNIENEIIKNWIKDDKIYKVLQICLKDNTRIPQEAINYEIIKNYKNIL
ncbi:Wadjet anti-phage system protein JetD domain-containing protein [Campylobacter sp. MG1]|uniref:Wadjet anti-phage system protein JetD domain-containing protein n=1 Tax=Campylobacter sp. MG1 TaxID=2976332 RepID=UPI00226D3689|nr:Wadjet anti-phage system protein JetD domain-containing protein [Campylobacter sp. MG1]